MVSSRFFPFLLSLLLVPSSLFPSLTSSATLRCAASLFFSFASLLLFALPLCVTSASSSLLFCYFLLTVSSKELFYVFAYFVPDLIPTGLQVFIVQRTKYHEIKDNRFIASLYAEAEADKLETPVRKKKQVFLGKTKRYLTVLFCFSNLRCQPLRLL